MANVLVVDDEQGIRRSLNLFLTRDGHQVELAANANDALHLLHEIPIDLVITDIVMPRESGVDLLNRIKEIWPDMPVIIITGEPDFDSLLDSVQAGAYTFLTKPFDRATICKAVRDAYGTSLQRRQSGEYQRILEDRVSEQTSTIRTLNRRLQRIASATRDFSLADTPETLAARVLWLFGEIMGVSGGSFYALRGQQLELLSCLDPGHQRAHIPLPPPAHSVIERLFFEREALVVTDIRLDMDLMSSGWSGYEDGSFIAFPLQDDLGEICGVVTFHNKTGAPFGRQDLDLGALIIAHANAALKTLRLTDSLRRSEQNFRHLIESAVTGVSVVREGNFRYVNQRMADILGYRVEDLIGRDYLDVIFPEDRERVAMFSRRRMSGEEAENRYAVRFIHRDGHLVWVEISASQVIFEGEAALLGYIADISDRIRMERELAESERRFRHLFETSKDGITFINTDGKILDCNDTFCDMVGYSRDEVLNRTSDDLTPKHLQRRDREILREQVFPKGFSERFQKELRHRDGSTFPVEVDVYLVRDANGRGSGFWAHVRDIRERLAAEREIRESENHFRQFSDRALTGIVVHRAGVMLYLNSRILKMLGYGENERDPLLGTTIFNHIHPDDQQRVRAWLQVWESGSPDTPDHFDLRLMTRDRHVVWAETLATTVQHEGKPAVLAHLMDVTERKNAEKALLESERSLARVIEGAPLGILIAHSDGNLDYVNSRFVEAYGYTREGLNTLEEFWRVAFPDADTRQQVREWIRNREKPDAGAGEDMEWPIICADGGQRYAEILCTSLGNRELILLRDVTARVLSERERAALEAQLLHAQKMEAVGRLAGGIAHDFNNLLTGINGNIQLAMMEIDKESNVYHMLENTTAAVGRTGELTRQLLAFSRKQTISPRKMDLNIVLHQLQSILGRLIGEDVRIQINLDPKLWDAEIDPTQIEQAVMNLVLNARDAMPGGGTLTLSTRNMHIGPSHAIAGSGLPAGDYVVLEVRDTGEGIDPILLDQIFEPFFTTKQAGKGTGLGLSMVYGIVRQHKGAVGVESVPREGTTFSLYFPRSEAQTLEAPASVSEGQTIKKGNETILVVEDEPMVRSIAVQMLKRLGYSTLEAENGREAIEVAESYKGIIELMLTDVVMPEMNGREAAEALHLLRPQTRVLFTSGYTDEIIGAHGILARGVEFLPKPYSFRQLADHVRRILDA